MSSIPESSPFLIIKFMWTRIHSLSFLWFSLQSMCDTERDSVPALQNVQARRAWDTGLAPTTMRPRAQARLSCGGFAPQRRQWGGPRGCPSCLLPSNQVIWRDRSDAAPLWTVNTIYFLSWSSSVTSVTAELHKCAINVPAQPGGSTVHLPMKSELNQFSGGNLKSCIQ